MNEIRKLGDPVLTTPTSRVDQFNPEELKKLVKKMISVMKSARGVGLAANQIGISKRICVIHVKKQQTTPVVYINPEIIDAKEEIIYREGCLSIPDVFMDTKRFNVVTVRYENMNREIIEETVTGTLAVAIQHEIDHLDGRLYIDRLSKIERQVAVDLFNQLQEEN